jgi:hypothetical protein
MSNEERARTERPIEEINWQLKIEVSQEADPEKQSSENEAEEFDEPLRNAINP